ncbi:MAG: DNA polymerase III subunit delta [Trueperaceae bacterium]
MILSFSGDPFLVARAARRALREQGLRADEVHELGEGLDPETVVRQGSQGGLFGRVGLLLDFDLAFSGKAGVKPRSDTIEALAAIPPETVVAVLDQTASAPRQKRYRQLGVHQHLPTPRFGALLQWVRTELQEVGVRFDRDVPETLVDLFGEDLPGITSEINKLQVLDEQLSDGRVREIAGRLAARGAFDLIDAISRGSAARALEICDSLTSQGEAPARVLAALNWQYGVVARCVAMRETRPRVGEGEVARELGVKPFVAKKTLGIATRLDERRLRSVLSALLDADRAMKSGRGEHFALEALTLKLCELFAGS